MKYYTISQKFGVIKGSYDAKNHLSPEKNVNIDYTKKWFLSK